MDGEEERPEGQEAPLVGFIFGNVEEKTGRVEADYLDEEAKEHLEGLARVQGGLDVQAELQADGEASAQGGGDVAGAAVQPAADARDYADEAELIEDAEAAAAAAAEQQRQLRLVGAALQAGAAAEEEDYDFDEEAPAAAAPAAAPPMQLLAPAAALPAAAAAAAAALAAAAPPRAAAPPGVPLPQLEAAQQLHVRLPVLGKSVDGETVLRFSELYGYQGVMAGHVANAAELRPPSLLPRGKGRAAAARVAAPPPAEEAEDEEEALMLAEHVEVPAEEEDGEESENPEGAGQQPRGAHQAAPLPAAAAQAQHGGQQQAQHARPGHPAREQQLGKPRGGAADAAAPADDADGADAPGTGSSGGSVSDLTFGPLNTLAWEDKVCWYGADAGESEHETDEEPAATEPDWGQPDAADGGYGDQQLADGQATWGQVEQQQPEQQQFAQADIAAMFQQQPVEQQALGVAQFGGGLPLVFNPPAAGPGASAALPMLSMVQQQHQLQHQPGQLGFSDEMPGLTSAAAAETAARAAADSDDEEFMALPRAPLLRLELQRLMPAGGEDGSERALRPAPDMLPVHREAWEERIAWDGVRDARRIRAPPTAFDLNDASQAFELTQPVAQQPAAAGRVAFAVSGSAADVAALVSQAAALIIQPQAAALPLPPRGSGYDASNPEEVELWRLQQGLAREREYHHLARRKAGTGAAMRVLHAKLANDLATVPILNPNPQSQDELEALSLWHTPRGKWWPVEAGRVALTVGAGKKGKSGGAGLVTVNISSLTGLHKAYQSVTLDSRLQDLWKHLVDYIALFKPAAGMQPLMLLPGRPPLPLPLDQPLYATGAVKEGQKQVKLSVAFQDIELLRTAVIAAVPSNDNPALLRPPNAFTRKRDFSAAEPGHVVLLEYMEQQPPLLNRPGMGAKLVTYYRKQDPADQGHQKLKQERPRWCVGTVQPLGDDDDSPFLGQLAKGGSSLSVESGLFRALAHPYAPPHTDFLLLRAPAGTMQLRELDSTVVVGQQLPMLRVPAPNAREVKDLEERRIYVHVFKHLRRQQAKLDKDPAKQGQRASITLKALAEAFPNRPPAMTRSYLKDACDLAVRPLGDTETFSLKEGARPPSEAELRKKLTPEETCALEACYVAAFRMKHRGLVMHEKLDKAAIEKLRLAAEMLPPEDSFQKAARLVEQAMVSAPWTLTDAFVTHFREGKAQLQLAGAADPTGRGFGYSFVRDIRHKHTGADDITKQMAKRQAGKVQGTDADLRRMTTAQAKERLRNYGLTEDEITGLGRWTMIDMVRQLASAAALDGTVDATAVKFVRHQKTTLIELQRRAAEKAQQILEKQMAVLNDTAAEDLGDQDALEAELEKELAAEEAVEGEDAAGPTPQRKKKKDGTPTPDDEQKMMQQMRAEGLMAAPAGGTAGAVGAGTALPAGSGGPPPKDGVPGTRRIRREVFFKASHGSWQKSHEILYVGRDRPGQLHSLYQKEGAGNYPFGFGTRTIAGRPKELRLSYAAARGRGVGRSAPRAGSGGGRGRGGGKKSKAAAIEEASPEALRERKSGRQRKARQFADDDFDELLSDEDFDFNEEAELPYFAVPEAKPKQPRSKKKKAAAPAAEDWGGDGAVAAQEVLPALPDDFAAALAAATMVRAPSAPAVPEQQPSQQQQAVSAGAPSQATAAGAAPSVSEVAPPDPQAGAAFPQDVQQPAAAPAPAQPKFKIKFGGAAPALLQPLREPSPDFVYDFTVGEEEEEPQQPGGRRAKAADADYEVHEADDGSDDFVPEDEDISEEDIEERRFLKKARFRSGRFDAAPAGRTASRRSTGSAVRRGGGGAAKRKSGGGGARGGGGGGAQRKRRRSEYEEEFDDEEDEAELSDDVDTLDDDDVDISTDEEGTAQPSRQRGGGSGGGAAGASGMGAAGQLGAVGRQLGAILGSIVHQLRNIKKTEYGYVKPTKVYDLVFGRVPSKTQVPDYHSWVPKPQVMILPEMAKKAKSGRYLSLEQFRADLQQLYQNAVAYNTPGQGRCGAPVFIEVAASLLADAEGLIATHLEEIEAAEGGQRYGQPPQQQHYGYAPPPY